MSNPGSKTFSLKIVIILALIQFTNLLDANVMMPLGAWFQENLGLTPSAFGILVASYSYAAFLSGLLAMKWIDRFERKKLFLFLYAGFIVGALLCTFVKDELPFLLFARGVTGAFGGILGSCLVSIIADGVTPETRGQAMGIFMIAGPLSAVCGVPFALWISEHFNWHSIFFVISVIAVLMWLVAWKLLPEMKAKEEDQVGVFEALKYISSNKNALTALGIMALQSLALNLVMPFISTDLVNNVGIPENKLPIIYLVAGLASIIIAPFAGKMADKFGHKKSYFLWLFLSIPPLLILTMMGHSSIYFSTLVGALMMAFNMGRRAIAAVMAMGAVKSAFRGRFMVINTTLQSLVLAGGASLGGFLLKTNSQGQLLNLSTLGILAVVLFLATLPLAMRLNSHVA